MEIMDWIYDSLQGILIPEAHMPGVENLFAEGSTCERSYGEIRDAYDRICARMGQKDEDADLEIILNAGMEICRELSYAMFRHGKEMAKSNYDGIHD